MAKSVFVLCFLFISFATCVFSRVILPEKDNHVTAILDVSSSVQKTIDILSFNPDQILQEEEDSDNEAQSISAFSSSFSFTAKVQSRDTILKSTHKDYETLTLDRLKRDSARVDSIITNLDLAISKSDLKPLVVEKEFEELKSQDRDNIVGPITSGLSHGSGEYFSRVGVGHPPKPQYLVLDTGSDVTWVQCAPCTECYQQTDPIFEPSSSTSFAHISCDAQQCKSLDNSACSNESCLYQVNYGDGSYTIGDFVSETLTFDNSKTTVEKISIGCGHDNEGLFIGSAGLLALGAGSLSFPSQVKATAFSYCLVDRDSSSASTIQFGPEDQPADAITAPLLRNSRLPTFYFVGLTGMSVGGQPLNLSGSVFDMSPGSLSGVIVDSGTSVTRLRTDVYNALRDAFVEGTQHLPSAGAFALFDTCYDLSSKTTVSVPTVAFLFPGGKSLVLPAKNYLVPVDSKKTFCFAFAPTRQQLSIIGNLQQQGTRVSYDTAKSVVGFSPNKC
ncbi:hypothetical protein MKW94_001689 [Papaver nudicaule]|uniref:Peptidase A1 domain-containing protein n=1 Tax=Papaver nudicaule TaxID=74823 RepID=A0AA41SH79_PAPNU|nr:hypothetical protein [Papaver nudicaule]